MMGVLLVTVWLWLLMDAPAPDPTTWLTDPSKLTIGGLLGLGITAFIRGWVVPKPTYDALVKRCDALQAAADRLLQTYQNREEEQWKYEQARRLAGKPEEGAAR